MANSALVGLYAVFLGGLVSLFGFFPLIFRGTIFRGTFSRPNLRFSLFAFEAVDFIPQFLVLAFKVLVFLTEGLDKVEQFADAVKGIFKAPDIVEVQTG